MNHSKDPVKRLRAALALGFSLPDSLPIVLGCSVATFARRCGHRESEVSMCLRGYPGRTYGAIREDLASELGVSRSDVDDLISEASGETPGRRQKHR